MATWDVDYSAVFAERARRLSVLRSDPKVLQAAKVHYKDHPADFITDWGMTYDPRKMIEGGLANIPFVLWPKQVEYLAWLDDRYKRGARGLVEKSRDCGVTWLSVGWSVARWCFNDGFAAGFGSRKEQLVDKIGDPDSIFEKVRHFVAHIPDILLPDGFVYRDHATYMRLISPNTGASITGESGDNIGRGGRKSIYFVDEAAFIEHQEMVDAALSQTTNCQIDISTFNGNGNLFYQKQQRFLGTDRHFVFDWAQPIDAKVLTPSGWKLMGELAVGDKVIGSSGKPVNVVGVYPKGIKRVYEIAFNDGASTECCDEHLWAVIPCGNQRAERRHITKLMTLSSIKKDYIQIDSRGFRKHNYQIPITGPVEFDSSALPIDPYVLGCFLGDGHFPNVTTSPIYLTTVDSEMVDIINRKLPPGCSLKRDKDIQYRVASDNRYRGGTKGRGLHNPVVAAVKVLGLSGKKSYEKFIPDDYKYASQYDRLEIIRGLLDTDGSVVKSNHGTAKLSTTSRRLAEDVVFMIETLGGTGTIYNIPAGRREFPGGRMHDCREGFSVSLKIPQGVVPFRLSRKIDTYSQSIKYGVRRSITNISFAGEKECRCIKVSAENGLYLTDHCIVTHNTDDPRKDDDWYRRQKEEQSAETVAQEIDRDPNASNTDAFIPAAWVVSAIDSHIKLGFDPSGVRTTGFDPADTGDNKGIVNRWGSVITEAEELTTGDITAALPWAFHHADNHNADMLLFDGDGMGTPVLKVAMSGMAAERFDIRPYHGSGEVRDKKKHLIPDDKTSKTNGDTYLNFRAQSATWVRDRFKATYDAIQRKNEGVLVGANPDDLISISSKCKDLRQLQAELSRPKRVWTKNGKIQVESKKEMRARGVDSPGLFDATVIAFSENKAKAEPTKIKYKIHRPRDRAMGY